MNEGLIEIGVFLLGAGSGALLNYLQDRKLLRYYGALVDDLSRALQQQVDGNPKTGVLLTMPAGPAGQSTRDSREGTKQARVTTMK